MGLFATLFLVALFVPLQFYIGPLYMEPYRLVLIVALFPSLATFISNRRIRFCTADGLIIAHVLWASLAIFLVHGTSYIEKIGIYALEILSAYFLARTQIRTPRAFRQAFTILLTGVAIMLPIALFESLTNVGFFESILGRYTVGRVDYPPRLGLFRAQAAFDHPILYGVTCASLLAPMLYFWRHRRNVVTFFARVAIPMAATALSMSSGALAFLGIQFAGFAWDTVARVRHKWWLLLGLVSSAYVALDLLSSRTPYQVAISLFSLNTGTAFNRLRIWTYASDDLFRNPMFGIGFNEWTRPSWMLPSVDNFWLVTALRYGIPGFALLLLCLLFGIAYMARARLRDRRLRQLRTGHIIMISGMSLAILTVHIWNQPLALYVFYVAAGLWLGTAGEAPRRRRRPLADDGSEAAPRDVPDPAP
ncbi:hypothetical protein F1188_18345 [Roseospira marina]|uniref:O-antigen ligase family protein n=1 Tax=Roseospira marina TaxID=140057 RepID=A0A5M6I6U9_9PROT|nr:hypothetical protein [Roseospira marina]KAA5603981.1 hypothetical protein F1188_18345 [Roseospira marina]MBB4315956.1 hypothetical protein [Roseospira marina]MBB5089083.1 hypothetical protein [Roseospira marina]